jgi:Arc/MetJ-type ribon-helix-helix transcriptional regulator
MEIRLRPELADLIKEDVERGSYASVGDYVEQATTMLPEQETWLTASRSRQEEVTIYESEDI